MDNFIRTVQKYYDHKSHPLFDSLYAWINRYALAPFFRTWLNPKGKILDAGTGAGYLAKELTLENAFFLDLSWEQIRRFKDSGTPGLFIQADCVHLPFDNDVFDQVICSNVLHYTGLKGLGELIRVTKPGGQLLVAFLENSQFTQAFTCMAAALGVFPVWMKQSPFIRLSDLAKYNLQIMDQAMVAGIPPAVWSYRNLSPMGLVALVCRKTDGNRSKIGDNFDHKLCIRRAPASN